MALSGCECIVDAFMGYQGITKRALLKHKSDLKPSQIMILTLLDMNGQTSMGALASQLAISKEQASRAIIRLVDSGYVERSHDTANRRVVNVSLTEEGARLVDALHDAYDEFLWEGLGRLDEAEKQELAEISCRAAELLRKALG